MQSEVRVLNPVLIFHSHVFHSQFFHSYWRGKLIAPEKLPSCSFADSFHAAYCSGNIAVIYNIQFSSLEWFILPPIQKEDAKNEWTVCSFSVPSRINKNFSFLLSLPSGSFSRFSSFLFSPSSLSPLSRGQPFLPDSFSVLLFSFHLLTLPHLYSLSLREALLLPKLRPLIIRTAFKESELSEQNREKEEEGKMREEGKNEKKESVPRNKREKCRSISPPPFLTSNVWLATFICLFLSSFSFFIQSFFLSFRIAWFHNTLLVIIFNHVKKEVNFFIRAYDSTLPLFPFPSFHRQHCRDGFRERFFLWFFSRLPVWFNSRFIAIAWNPCWEHYDHSSLFSQTFSVPASFSVPNFFGLEFTNGGVFY